MKEMCLTETWLTGIANTVYNLVHGRKEENDETDVNGPPDN